MFSIRKALCRPKLDDWSPLAKFFYADEDLNVVATELDSFDGRKDPDRCAQLIARLRSCQDKVLQIIDEMLQENFPHEEDRAPRDYRVKFPDDILHDSLAGQLWFGAECLAAGSNIIDHEFESEAIRPLARAFTAQLESLRDILKDQSLRNPTAYPEKLRKTLRSFDYTFAEFELNYVSAMVPVKSARDYDLQLDVGVLLSETLLRALRLNYITKEQVDNCDPQMLITLPRLSIVCGLLIYPAGPLNLDRTADDLPEMFRPFRTLLVKIRDLLQTLTTAELSTLERALCSQEDPQFGGSGANVSLIADYRNSSSNKPVKTDDASNLHGHNRNNKLSQAEDGPPTKLLVNVPTATFCVGNADEQHSDRERFESESEVQVAEMDFSGTILEPDPENRSVDSLDSTGHSFGSTDEMQELQKCLPPTSLSSCDLAATTTAANNVPLERNTRSESALTTDSQASASDERASPTEPTTPGTGPPCSVRISVQGFGPEHSNSVPDVEISYSGLPATNGNKKDLERKEKLRSRFLSPEDLIHRLFVCISGVADQLQSNYPADLRAVLRMVLSSQEVPAVYEVNGRPTNTPAREEEVGIEANEVLGGGVSPTRTGSRSNNTNNTSTGNNNNNAVPWVPDSECSCCSACQAPFTLVRRRHHCRKCGKIFCARCSANSLPLPSVGYNKPVRVCNQCFLYRLNPFTAR